MLFGDFYVLLRPKSGQFALTVTVVNFVVWYVVLSIASLLCMFKLWLLAVAYRILLTGRKRLSGSCYCKLCWRKDHIQRNLSRRWNRLVVVGSLTG